MPSSCSSMPQVWTSFIRVSLVLVGVIYYVEVVGMRRMEGNAENPLSDKGKHITEKPLLSSSQLLQTISISNRGQENRGQETLPLLRYFKESSQKLNSRKKQSLDWDDHTPTSISHHRLRHNSRNKHKSSILLNLKTLAHSGVNTSQTDRRNASKKHSPNKELRDSVTLTRSTPAMIERRVECYGTDDVLLVVAITCLLNFSVVFLLRASIRWVNRAVSWMHWTRTMEEWKMMRRKRKRRTEGGCWEDEIMSDSTSTTMDDYDYKERDKRTSCSMEDLRFYH